MHCDAEVSPRGMFGGDCLGLDKSVDPIQAAEWQMCACGNWVVRGELNTLESIGEEEFEARQAFEIRPHAICAKIKQVIEV
jgi:hypothetical protein